MKIAFLSDSHYDESSRFDECIRLHDWIAKDAAERGCRIVLHGGDVFERRSTPKERLAVADWLHRVGSLGMDAMIARGNHDAPGDLHLINYLALGGMVYEQPGERHLTDWLRIACLPWPSRASILATAASREDGEQQIAEAVRDLLRGLRSEEPGVTTLFLGHCMVRDSRTSTGQPLVGCDVEVGLEDLALVGADAYLLGHIHLHQQWDINGAPVIYPGSPRRTAFGESEAKGYVVLTVEEGLGVVGWEFIEAPATPMVHVEAEWVHDHVGLPGDTIVPAGLCCHKTTNIDDLRGAEVRFRWHVEPEHRQAARAAAERWRCEALGAGAVVVKLEEVVEATTRARAPEVAAALTVRDKLRALWTSRGEPTWETLLSMSTQLEEEVSHAP
jgi:DNA repair exonuclease SbcCD nuclease subunit